MHARYYNPRFGRFLSPDPIMNDLTNGSAGWSRYSYAGNNPLRNIDSTGNYGEDVHHDLTNALARAAGFSQQNAEAIADATQAIDRNWRTGPFWSVRARRLYHFTTQDRRAELLETALNSPLEDSQFFEDTGAYMHALQD
jgi:hypothetical protein